MITARFVYGLKDEVRAMVAMQRPNNLDTTCSLALLHEDVWTGRREDKRIKNHGMSKGYQKNSLVAGNLVPMASHRGLPQNDERRRTNSSSYKAKDSKLAALKAYRRAKGLCFKCVKGGTQIIPVPIVYHYMWWKKCG
jgi:hypothetical protein